MNYPRVSKFLNCLYFCGLIDLGYKGLKYTRTNKRKNTRTLIMERFDIYVANSSWINLFKEVHVTHLSRILSYHYPIKLDLFKTFSYNNNIFRIESMWLSHPTFKNLVEESWTTQK